MSNALDNILDVFVLLLLFLGIGLLSFAFNFSFSLVPLQQAASVMGLQPFSYASKEFIADTQAASLKTLFKASSIVVTLLVFVWLRRRILTPLTGREFVFLFIAACPLPLWFLVKAFDVRLCVFPLSDLMSSGAIIMGRSEDSFHFCKSLVVGDTPAATVFGVYQSLYAIALVPLNLAFLSSIGLITFNRSKASGLRLRSFTWPLHWLRNFAPAAVARTSRQDLHSVFWLLILALVVPIAVLFSWLPMLSAAEVNAVKSVFPAQYQDGHVAATFVGFYAGPGRQLLLLVLSMAILLFFLKRWFMALSIIFLSLIFPISVFYLFTNHYLFVASSGQFLVVMLFILLTGWAAYVFSFPHWRRLLNLLLSVLALASRRASKEVRRLDDPIIYLRPFALDNSTVPTLPSIALRMTGTQSRVRPIESCIADAAFKFAPLVALGDRSVAVEPVGAVREYTSNYQWKERVTELLARPRAVLFLVGATSATNWEVETIIDNALLSKTVFILPPDSEVVRQFFLENDVLLKHFQITASELVDGVSQGWVALWSDRYSETKKFSAGRVVDELSYKLAVSRALAEVG